MTLPYPLLFRLAGAVLLCHSLMGCQQGRREPSYYALDPIRPTRSAPSDVDSRLELRRFSIDSQFASRALIYRRGDLEFQTDPYHQMIVTPAPMITDKVRTWLSGAGLPARVLDPGSLLLATYSLEGNVIAMYGDFRDHEAPVAVMDIRVFLIQHEPQGDGILMAKTYETRVLLESPDAPGLVGGYNRCLVQILTGLEEDLRGCL